MALTVAEKDLKKRELFLEGNILKGVLTVCVPMAAFQLLNELFRVFDLAITARINPESVAAVSFFNQLNNSVTAVGTGLSIGAGILIAGFYGAADYENVKKTVNTTFFLAVGGALLLAISLILSGKWVLRLANTPEELVEIGWNYYRVIMVNLVFVFFNNVYVAIEKARGNGGRILGVNLLMAAAKFTLSGVFVLIFPQRCCDDRFFHFAFQPACDFDRYIQPAGSKGCIRDITGIYPNGPSVYQKAVWYFSPCDGRKICFQYRQGGSELGRSGLWYPDSRRFGSVQQYQRIVYGSGRKHR